MGALSAVSLLLFFVWHGQPMSADSNFYPWPLSTYSVAESARNISIPCFNFRLRDDAWKPSHQHHACAAQCPAVDLHMVT
jgi:predicted alpha/beta hydrolase